MVSRKVIRRVQTSRQLFKRDLSKRYLSNRNRCNRAWRAT
jgi:hypothetical protein